MANTKSPNALGQEPMVSPMGSELVNVMLTAQVAAADLAAGDLIILGEIPEDCVLVDAVYVTDDLDSNGTPAIALDFGTINAGETDLATTVEAGLTIGRAGGAARMTPTAAALATKGKVGFKVATAAATGQAGAASVSLTYRQTYNGK